MTVNKNYMFQLANVGKEEEDSSTSSEEKAIKKEGKADKTPSSSQKTSMIKGSFLSLFHSFTLSLFEYSKTG